MRSRSDPASMFAAGLSHRLKQVEPMNLYALTPFTSCLVLESPLAVAQGPAGLSCSLTKSKAH